MGTTLSETLDFKLQLGYPFQAFDEASHLSNLGTRPEELEHSCAESSLKASAFQVVR
jgi:hypothetical protein